MLRLRRFFDEGSGGGGAPAAVTDPKDGSLPPKAEGGSGDPAAAVSDPGKVEPGDKKTEDGKDTTPPDYKALYEADQAKHKETSDSYEALKSKVGKQANELSSFVKLDKMLKSENKQAALAEMAKMHNIEVKFPGTEEVKLTDEEGNFNADNMEAFKEQLKAETKADFAQQFSALHEANLEKKYSDWVDHASERESLMRSVLSQDVSQSELHHLAVRGQNMDKTVAAAMQRGEDEYIAKLAKKQDGGRDAGGGSSADSQEKTGERLNFANKKDRERIMSRSKSVY